jgi:hypothetical protein
MEGLNMTIKSGFIYLIIASFLIINACQKSEHPSNETNGSANIENREQMIDPMESSNIDSGPKQSETEGKVGKIVTLGIEGYEQDIEFDNYHNGWVDLWYDSSLDVTEEDHKVLFHQEKHDLTFSVTHMDTNITQEEKYAEIEEQMAESGFDLINDFPLEKKTGEGYIFYSSEKQKSIDVYFLRDEQDFSILVEFAIPENMMDDYISRFEYMLQTIDLKS